MDRRQFACDVVAGTSCLAAGLTSMTSSAAEEPRQNPPKDKPAAKQVDKPAADDEKPDLPPEVLLLSYLVRQYPSDHFDKEAVAGIYRDIRGDVARGRMLQEFPLKNSDEPAFVFRAWSAEGVER
jgi:hypothetical protein